MPILNNGAIVPTLSAYLKKAEPSQQETKLLFKLMKSRCAVTVEG